MTFKEAQKQAVEWESFIAVIKNANWAELHGRFSAEQLRAIADEIENQYGNKKRHNSGLGSIPSSDYDSGS